MSEPTQPNPPEDQHSKSQSERTARVTAVGWTAGLSTLFLVMGMGSDPTWPMAVGVCAIAAMVASACYFMLR